MYMEVCPFMGLSGWDIRKTPAGVGPTGVSVTLPPERRNWSRWLFRDGGFWGLFDFRYNVGGLLRGAVECLFCGGIDRLL